jgi:hypothetical protein
LRAFACKVYLSHLRLLRHAAANAPPLRPLLPPVNTLAISRFAPLAAALAAAAATVGDTSTAAVPLAPPRGGAVELKCRWAGLAPLASVGALVHCTHWGRSSSSNAKSSTGAESGRAGCSGSSMQSGGSGGSCSGDGDGDRAGGQSTVRGAISLGTLAASGAAAIAAVRTQWQLTRARAQSQACGPGPFGLSCDLLTALSAGVNANFESNSQARVAAVAVESDGDAFDCDTFDCDPFTATAAAAAAAAAARAQSQAPGASASSVAAMQTPAYVPVPQSVATLCPNPYLAPSAHLCAMQADAARLPGVPSGCALAGTASPATLPPPCGRGCPGTVSFPLPCARLPTNAGNANDRVSTSWAAFIGHRFHLYAMKDE